jgi:hypothetical protein
LSYTYAMASFEQQIKGVTSRFASKSERFVKRTVFGIAESVIEMSPVGDPSYWKYGAPVGYVGGRFRANWDYGFNSIPKNQYEDVDKSGKVSMARVKSGMTNAFGVHYIVNNLEYSQKLENGWSRQAPNGMVKLTAMKFGSFVKDALR